MEIRTIDKILKANDALADAIRADLEEKKVFAVNVIGSPGSGKTSILEALIPMLISEGYMSAVIEGDMCTSADAERIMALGVPVVQVNTDNMGGACHLDANMIRAALNNLDIEGVSFLFIENVGNLVCPAEFDVGEEMKMVVLSTTEGEDKPAKYPLAFTEAGLLVLNKTDLLPYVSFNREKALRSAKALNPDLDVISVCAVSGEGIQQLSEWLTGKYKRKYTE